MSEYVNITNMYELANAIKERTAVEIAKLEFEKEVFKFNQQISVSSTKSNEDMVEIMRAFTDRFDTIDKAIRTLADNDAYLKKEIDSLNNSSKPNPVLGIHASEFYKQKGSENYED